ncbi:MAG: hypothetical protein ACRDGA_13250 [Bacteroidota bacterium]
MRTLLLLMLSYTVLLSAQSPRDTLYFDATSGNYVIKYFVEDEDTLITTIFEPSTKVNPSITTKVEHVGDTLLYRYAISNGADSKQNLFAFEIEYQAEVIDASVNRWRSGKMFDGKVENNRWIQFEAGRWRWSGDQGLQPTWHKDGFALKSKSVPGIVKVYFQGNAGEFSAPFGGPSFELDQQIAQLQIFPANRVIRKTVGPVLPPTPFVPLAFLDTLISYKHQAFDLGWIKNRGIIQSLNAKLENARAQLRRNNKTAARNILQSFVNEVEALWKEENQRRDPQGVQITSEAYALLKFNAEYLLSKL